MSRSTWACELKSTTTYMRIAGVSHAPRERVSWNALSFISVIPVCGHAPRERVSWNRKGLKDCAQISVTLHVSVWVEIYFLLTHGISFTSRSTWACELKSIWSRQTLEEKPSRSTWACELKCKNHVPRTYPQNVTLHVSVWVEIETCEILLSVKVSRSTWACELKFLHRYRNLYHTLSRSTWACELKLQIVATLQLF